VLEGAAPLNTFWSMVHPDQPRPGGRWDGLRHAPVIVLPLVDKPAYLRRYAEADKAGRDMATEDGWVIPYWEVDTAFVVMTMLLAATNEKVGAAFFAVARGEAELLATLGVPAGLRTLGALALGHAANDDRPSPSVARGRLEPTRRLHWGRWGGSLD
jgi:hypothetical protein